MATLSRDPLDNPDLTPETRAALEALPVEDRIAISKALAAAYRAEIERLIAAAPAADEAA